MDIPINLDWDLVTAIILFVLTTLSKYLGSFRIKHYTMPTWIFFLSVLLLYLLIVGFVSFIGVILVSTIICASLLIDATVPFWVRFISGLLAGISFLGLGFHAFPGFENELLLDAQIIKESSTPYTAYFNFDKTIGGLVFFLVVLPSESIPTARRILSSLLIAVSTIIIVLSGGMIAGLIEFNITKLLESEFLLLFLVLQLFSVCLAEEMFFRGFIQHRMYFLFKKNSLIGKVVPLLVTSIFFGLVHFAGGIGYVVAATFAGIGYGLVYQLTRRIEASIITHAMLNLTHLIFFTYPFASVSSI